MFILRPKSIPKLNSTKILISKALTYSNIIQVEFVLKNNVLKENNDFERRNQNFKDLSSSSKTLVYL